MSCVFLSARPSLNEHKTCSGINTCSSQCGSKYKTAAPEFCPGLVCHKQKSTRKVKTGCEVENGRDKYCVNSRGKDACCDDLVCHSHQSWRCFGGKTINVIYSFVYL